MRSLAGLFLMSIITVACLAVPTSSSGVDPAPTIAPATFIPAKTAAHTPTPTTKPEDYRLRVWTEQDAADTVSEAESTLWGTDVRDFYSEFAARLYLLAVLQEMFLRFPETQSQDWPLWESIREEVNQGYGIATKYGVGPDRFLREVEKAINSGRVKTADLGGWLEERGFNLSSRHSASNFFGDGQEGEFLQIQRPQPLFESDLWVILEGARPGAYRLTSLGDSWRSLIGRSVASEEVSVADHNGNGRPEISLLSGPFAKEYCNTGFYLYEWLGDRSNGHLRDITLNAFGGWGTFYGYIYWDCRLKWEFGAPNSKETQPLFALPGTGNPAGEPCPDYEFRVRYEWNGQEYVWVGGEAVPPNPGLPAQCLAGWALRAADQGLYDQAVPIVLSALSDWPQELDKLWGPSAKDYFRFKLGTWYGFAGKYDLAVEALSDVRDHPADREHDMVSRMADVFLSRYQISTRANEACFEVHNFVDMEFNRIPKDEREPKVNDTVMPRWGIAEPDWRHNTIPADDQICYEGYREGFPPLPESTPTPKPTASAETTPSSEQVLDQLADRMELIEEELFTRRDARHAAELARGLLAEPILPDMYKNSNEVEPHLLYLLALSSELAGDNTGAVTAYWQILHEYPKSHYAAMARRKLEPLTPQARLDMQAPGQ